TKHVIQILENLQKFSQEQFDNLEYIIIENGEEIKSNTNSLSKLVEITGSISSKLDEIKDLFNKLREQGTSETEQIKGKIDKLENNILVEFDKLGVPKFDYTITAERLLFYFKLKFFLDNANDIFKEQNKVARNMMNEILKKGHKISTKKRGLDYALYDLHKNNLMDMDDLKNFEYIRKVTCDRGERLNWYAKELLTKNEVFVKKSMLLAELKVHYSAWQAKFQLYKDDPNMCLIYVGPDQYAGFPKAFDDYINEVINQLKK